MSTIDKEPRIESLADQDFNGLRFCLMQIQDPRELNVTHTIENLLILMLVSMAGGANSVQSMLCFCEGHAKWFERIFNIKDIPSVHTFYRILASLDPKHLESALRTWVKNWISYEEGEKLEIISLDGKAMRGYKGDPLQVVSAVAKRNGLILGGVCTEGAKRNELSAMIQMVNCLSLKGCIITADAMGTQTKLVDAICEKGGDYALPVSGNQGNTEEATVACFDNPSVFGGARIFEQVEKGHGRLEERYYELIVFGKKKPEEFEKWKKIKGVGKAVSKFTKNGIATTETRYFITSVEKVESFAQAVRGHWQVESMHWVLDVTFGEDNCVIQNKNAQQNLNAMRKIVANVIKINNPKAIISRTRMIAGWNETELCKLMKLFMTI